MSKSFIKLLLVEDSPVARELLVHIFSSVPDIRIVGITWNGEAAINLVSELRPDVVVMDVKMPKLDGIETTRTLMANNPVPIVLVSGAYSRDEVVQTFKALELGAVAVLEKPYGVGNPGHKMMADELIETVRIAATTSVKKKACAKIVHRLEPIVTDLMSATKGAKNLRVIAFGASTGGPVALKTILSPLPREFHAPIIVVQHIAPGFLEGMVEWLQMTCSLPIHIAQNRQVALPGNIYFAPDDKQCGISLGNKISLTAEPAENGLRPAVSYLFRSLAKNLGSMGMGVLLTGMGKDGAGELRLMRDTGALTLAQDKESSTIYGMPGEAEKLGAAMFHLSPLEIVTVLLQLMNYNPTTKENVDG